MKCSALPVTLIHGRPAPEGCDDYVVNALRDLDIQNVRLGYSYDSVDAATERFLVRLLDEGFDVLLALLPPKQDAANMASPFPSSANPKLIGSKSG